jgi:hypothetical protein
LQTNARVYDIRSAKHPEAAFDVNRKKDCAAENPDAETSHVLARIQKRAHE